MVTFELIHHMRNKGRGNKGEIALKLDVNKAYERVNWGFLKHIMLNLDLGMG